MINKTNAQVKREVRRLLDGITENYVVQYLTSVEEGFGTQVILNVYVNDEYYGEVIVASLDDTENPDEAVKIVERVAKDFGADIG